MFCHRNMLIGVAYIQRTSKESEGLSAAVHIVVPLHEINGLGMQQTSIQEATAYPDCIQTGMYARRALIPPKGNAKWMRP